MVISIDIGGTKISAALIENGQILRRQKIASTLHQDVHQLVQDIIDICNNWRKNASQIAIACTGLIGDEEVNFLSINRKLKLKQILSEQFQLPVTILNDAAAAAWAEYCSRDKPQCSTLVYVTVSTGIGGGIIQNGQLVTSTDGFCAHLGHVSVPSQSELSCHCGMTNCIEALASGTAIGQRASQLLKSNVSCLEVFEHHASLPEIQLLLTQCAKDLCSGLASIKAMTGTETIVLGGSVGLNPIFRDLVNQQLKQLPELYRFNLEAPACGKDADVIGAYLFATKENR